MKVILLGALLLPIVSLGLGIITCLSDWFGDICEKTIAFVKYTIFIVGLKFKSVFQFDSTEKAMSLAYMYNFKESRRHIFSLEDIKIWKAFL